MIDATPLRKTLREILERLARDSQGASRKEIEELSSDRTEMVIGAFYAWLFLNDLRGDAVEGLLDTDLPQRFGQKQGY